MLIQIELRHVYELIFTRIRRRRISIELMISSLSPFLNIRQILFLRINIPKLIGNNQIVKYFSIPPKFVFLNFKLVLLYKFKYHFILLNFLLIPYKLPYKLRVIHKTHYITYLVQIIPPLQYLRPFLVFLCRALFLFEHLIPSLLGLLPLLP
jgi:hypothetical protein